VEVSYLGSADVVVEELLGFELAREPEPELALVLARTLTLTPAPPLELALELS
jgi:hypothetical protein